MDDFELFSVSGMTNSSDAMFARRRRILSEARRMIEHEGVETFSIRELCKRSKVAPRTIYNAFGSREHVIALAIRLYFEDFDRRVQFDTDPTTLEGLFDRLVTATIRNQAHINYVRAFVVLYFSPTANLEVRELLLSVGRRIFIPALQALQLNRQIERYIDIARLSLDLSNLRAGIVHEWGIEAIDVDEYFRRTIVSNLIMLIGATRGVARVQIRRWFNDFLSSGPLSTKFIEAARQRLVDFEDGEPQTSDAPKPSRKLYARPRVPEPKSGRSSSPIRARTHSKRSKITAL